MKINLTLVLILGWILLIISSGTFSGLFSFKIGTRTLSEVRKPDIAKKQQLQLENEGQNSKIIDENKILMRVENYIKLQQEKSDAIKQQEQSSSKLRENQSASSSSPFL